MSNTTKWLVRGMNCVSCAGTVNNFLKSEGMDDIHVDFSTDEVQFVNTPGLEESYIIKGIEKLGYKVSLPDEEVKKKSTLSFL